MESAIREEKFPLKAATGHGRRATRLAGMGTLMKVHILNRDTSLYFAGANDWTAQIDAAFDFGNVIQAVDFVMRQNMSSVDVLMHFENSIFDIRLPLSH